MRPGATFFLFCVFAEFIGAVLGSRVVADFEGMSSPLCLVASGLSAPAVPVGPLLASGRPVFALPDGRGEHRALAPAFPTPPRCGSQLWRAAFAVQMLSAINADPTSATNIVNASRTDKALRGWWLRRSIAVRGRADVVLGDGRLPGPGDRGDLAAAVATSGRTINPERVETRRHGRGRTPRTCAGVCRSDPRRRW